MSAATGNSLKYWSARFAADGGRITDALIAEVAAKPGFTAATHAHIRDTLALHGSNPIASRLANDITRMILCYISLYLDAHDNLTRSAIRDLLSGLSLASPGRATAILMQLRLYKFIEPDPHQPDRRTRRYIPTQQMKKAFLELMSSGLQATALIEPETAALAQHLTDPLFFRGFTLALGDATLTMLRNLRGSERDMFADATSGYLMLYRLMLGGNEAVYPPRGPMPFARSALSREFKVSRSHVSRVFDTAARRGMVVYSSDRMEITLSETFRSAMARHHGAMFANNIRCMLSALDYVRAMRPQAA